ncbi:MAG: sensor domain-containing protein [Alphaproteobacteria bacterium]
MNTAPTTVRAYLDALKRALAGAPPALIRDALSDAEEHLRSEIAQNPDKSEADVLAAVIENYGTPEEIAEEYRSMEQTLAGASPFPRSEDTPKRRYGFFGVISDPRAYGALLYMLLSIATGTFYFTWLAAGLSISIGTLILIIGIPIALLFIGSIRVLSLVEGRIVEGLLGVRMPRRLPPQHAGEETIWAKIKSALADIRTWSSMAYFALMLPLGVAYFSVAVTLLTTSLVTTGSAIGSLVTGRELIQYWDYTDFNIATGLSNVDPEIEALAHFFNTAPGLILLALLGILLLFITLNIAKGIGWVHGRIAEALLVRL